MAPEQAESPESVDHRADIYALGVIMYELFTGHLPFEADTLMGVLTKHMFVEPPAFAVDAASDASRVRGVPADEETARVVNGLEAVTMRALAKKPELRIQSMAALAEELEQTVTFDVPGRVMLAAGWEPRSVRRPGRAIGELPRAVEGADRADVYPSNDLPVVPRTPILGGRGGVFAAAGVLALAAVAAVLSLRYGSPTGGAAAASAVPAPSASAGSAAPAASAFASVHITSVPPFAEVWQAGRRVGTAPVDLPIDPTGAPTQCTLRALGYAERTLVVDRTSTAAMQVNLDKVAPVATAPLPHAPPPASAARPARHRHTSDGELVDPFAR
jgi:serine/threonine-protein kinase